MGKSIVFVTEAGAVAPGQLLPTEERLAAVEASELSRAADRAREQAEARERWIKAHGAEWTPYRSVEKDPQPGDPDHKPYRPLRAGEKPLGWNPGAGRPWRW